MGTARPMTPCSKRVQQHTSSCTLCHLVRRLRGDLKGVQRVRDRGRWRLSVALALALGLAAAAFAVPASAANGDPDAVSRAGKQSLQIWAYFDGDTPVSGARVRVYAGGRRLRERGGAGGTDRTDSVGTALMQLPSLPSRLRVVVSGGRAGGRPVRGSLKAKVRGVTDGELVYVNPVTTVSDVWAHAEDGRSHRRARNVIERTLGIRRILDDADLFATDQWFDGDSFHRWTLEQGSVGAGARALVRHVDRPGFDRRVFRPRDGGGPGGARIAASGRASPSTYLEGVTGAISGAASLSGPTGAFIGVSLFVFNKLIAGVIDPTEDEAQKVSNQLNDISTQLTQLQAQLGASTFELKAALTDGYISKIKGAWNALQYALTVARKHDKGWKDDFRQATETFMDKAKVVADNSIDTELHDKLATKKAPGAGEPLLVENRNILAAQRFFTAESSRRMRGFFQYYELYQTMLATVLAEYIMQLKRPTIARKTVSDIKDKYLPKQRGYLPPKYLDTAPLESNGFIDNQTNLMWGVNPTYFDFTDLRGYGTYSGCRELPSATAFGPNYPNCGIDIHVRRAGYSGWHTPTRAEAIKLFENHPGNTLDWLKTLGVTFDTSSSRNQTYPVALWLRDRWQVSVREKPYSSYTRALQTTKLALTSPGCSPSDVACHIPDRGAPFKEPREVFQQVGTHCPVVSTGWLDAIPYCNEWVDTNRGGFILWVRGTTAEEREQLGDTAITATTDTTAR
jgi:hypothetical protein